MRRLLGLVVLARRWQTQVTAPGPIYRPELSARGYWRGARLGRWLGELLLFEWVGSLGLFSQAESIDGGLVAVEVVALEIVEQTATTANELQ